jgi:UDP-N-acetylglucosamine enolpyruvyl transferase
LCRRRSQKIQGGKTLSGQVAKLVRKEFCPVTDGGYASLFVKPVSFQNVPSLVDIRLMTKLDYLGVKAGKVTTNDDVVQS